MGIPPVLHRLASTAKSSVGRVRSWVFVAAAVLFLFLYLNIAISNKQLPIVDAHRAHRGSGYSLRAAFPGVYGMLALDKLISWNDNLFAATMTMYKRQAQGVCSDLRRTRDACVNATRVFRPPEPEGHAKYDLFQPYVHCPSGQKMMKRVGNSGEGGKWLCDELLQKDTCVIFSLGSNGQYDFEKALLEKTQCDIYTFDCTYDGRSLARRHKYVKKCIGSMAKAGENKNFVTLSQAAQDLRVKKIDLLKIDIEGYEFDEIAGWSVADFALPDQVSIEVHHSQVIYAGGKDSSRYKVQDFSNLLWPAHHLIASDLALFFGHLGRLGYAIVSREDNPFGNCCSEFLLLKVADWAALQ